jgi:hypothetical protein
VLVQISLNVNDWLRPVREAAAVARWLDAARKRELWPIEVSFTGHELEAFLAHAPDVVDKVRSAAPTITEHYRVLEYRHLLSTERELYRTDPATLALDRTRPGPAVLLQKTFGVTPRDRGGALCELLRAAWTTGADSEELIRLGFDRLQRDQQIAHPDRIVAWSLPHIDEPDPHGMVELYLRVRRLERDVTGGHRLEKAALLDAHADVWRWAQVAVAMGFDLGAVEALRGLVDVGSLPAFQAAFGEVEPTPALAEAVRGRAASEPDALATQMEEAMRELAARTTTLPTIGAELAQKVSELDPGTVYATRLAWHASNDYTAEMWSKHVFEQRAPLPQIAAGERSAGDQEAIARVIDDLLDRLAGEPRVRVASLHHDTQRAAENAPERAYPAVFGVELDRVPDALSAEAVDELARSRGIRVPEGRPGGPRGKAPPRGGKGPR